MIPEKPQLTHAYTMHVEIPWHAKLYGHGSIFLMLRIPCAYKPRKSTYLVRGSPNAQAANDFIMG